MDHKSAANDMLGQLEKKNQEPQKLKRRPPTFKKNISSKESEELIDERSKQKVFTDSEIKEITNV